MITIKEYEDGATLELYNAYMNHAGYGHKKVTVVLYYRGEKREFARTTSNMSEIDRISDMENYEEIQTSLFYLIANSLENELIEWMLEVDSEKE